MKFGEVMTLIKLFKSNVNRIGTTSIELVGEPFFIVNNFVSVHKQQFKNLWFPRYLMVCTSSLYLKFVPLSMV